MAPRLILDFLADCYNPLLVVLVVGSPFFFRVADRAAVRRYYGAAALGVLFVYLLKFLDDRFRLGASVGLDYSTHTALAVSLGVSLAVFWPSRRFLVPVSLAIYLGLIGFLGYHTPVEMASAGLLSALFTAGAHRVVGSAFSREGS